MLVPAARDRHLPGSYALPPALKTASAYPDQAAAQVRHAPAGVRSTRCPLTWARLAQVALDALDTVALLCAACGVGAVSVSTVLSAMGSSVEVRSPKVCPMLCWMSPTHRPCTRAAGHRGHNRRRTGAVSHAVDAPQTRLHRALPAAAKAAPVPRPAGPAHCRPRGCAACRHFLSRAAPIPALCQPAAAVAAGRGGRRVAGHGSGHCRCVNAALSPPPGRGPYRALPVLAPQSKRGPGGGDAAAAASAAGAGG